VIGKFCADDCLPSMHSRVTLDCNRLGGLPIFPIHTDYAEKFRIFYNTTLPPLLICSECKAPKYLIAQFIDPQNTTHLSIYYIFVCNTAACIKKSSLEDRKARSYYAFSLDIPRPPVSQPLEIAKEPLEIPEKLTTIGLDDCLRKLNLSFQINPSLPSDRTAAKKEEWTGMLMSDHTSCFPPVFLAFKEFDLPNNDDTSMNAEAQDDYSIHSEDDYIEEEEFDNTDDNAMQFIEEALSEEFSSFQNEVDKQPWQCIRFAPGYPLPSGPLPEETAGPKCFLCGSVMQFTFQIMPAFFQCLDTESFYNKVDPDKNELASKSPPSLVDLLDTKSMEWSTLLVYRCPSCELQPLRETQLVMRELRLVFQMDI
jgi:Programmed cell death protein 2, C-terminal putative domain